LDPGLAARRLNERGVTSVQFVLIGALSLLMFVVLANLVVVQYGRGAIRTALDQGARVGAVTGSVFGCRDRVESVLGQVLGGDMGDGITVSCDIEGAVVTVTSSAVFESWTPFTPDFPVQMAAHATLEPYGG
jgi:hypothetical protein